MDIGVAESIHMIAMPMRQSSRGTAIQTKHRDLANPRAKVPYKIDDLIAAIGAGMDNGCFDTEPYTPSSIQIGNYGGDIGDTMSFRSVLVLGKL